MTVEDQNQGEYRPRTARELRKMKEAEEKKKSQAEEGAHAEETAEQVSLHNPNEATAPSVERVEPVSVPADADELNQLREEMEALRRQAEESQQTAEDLQRKLKDSQEQVLRVRADLENFRRRSRKDREEAVKYAALPMIESLLPALDNLERALAAGGSGGDDVLHQGVSMVYRQLVQSLENHGLSVIEAEGLPFNPHEHNAVMEVEAEGVDAGTVVEELQKGYRYHDRVIRPSMVKVSS
ncbi:nucleotide exchange factor GrpE [Desmospora activa]|uniref:Protein GrpE n=1 Tax=Desmospora activa DSM 45169 TaxID=1121389 RepID=A0A2T4ZC99_9BACL|nr:nucleotide exchange factor GrpE [Desmospora activa]PTM59502.1 molecular chaperone GrpE [Desmospora activa DSM 45169]